MSISSQDLYNIFAVLGLIISVLGLVLQFWKTGPQIDLLNVRDVQQLNPRPHNNLPKDVQEAYPYIPDAANGHALVKIIFGNSGDRVGVVNIQNITAEILENGQDEIIKPWCDKYIVVPAHALAEKEILLRNIQISHNKILLEVKLNLEYGSYHPDSTKYKSHRTVEERIRVNLIPGDENPWIMSGENPFYV